MLFNFTHKKKISAGTGNKERPYISPKPHKFKCLCFLTESFSIKHEIVACTFVKTKVFF